MLPERQKLPHEIPQWVENGAKHFITVCTKPRGQNQLCNPELSKLLQESLKYRQDRGDLWVHLMLLMPDHLHGIITFSHSVGMQKSISDWKRYISNAGKIKWQRDFFDHRLRQDESYVEKAHYIRLNPVRAGLIESAEDWPYVWENQR